MRFKKALGLDENFSIAFLGAGGKTSLMFALAQELKPPIILTATTHLGACQTDFADIHVIIKQAQEIESIDFSKACIYLITGQAGTDERLGGVDEKILQKLREKSRLGHIPLLIEADGAKRKYLKAPAEHEPVIPTWVDLVVVVAGLGGLDRPLCAEIVQRPEIFSHITGRPMNEPISVRDVIAVLNSHHGGLKGVPGNCKKICFLNQGDGELSMAQASRVAAELMVSYDRVVIGSVLNPGKNPEVFSVHSQTAGIILAAGGSTRLGYPKQLLDWYGNPFVYEVVINALEAGLKPLIVVTGTEYKDITNLLESLPVKLVHNKDWEKGQSTSLKAGLTYLPPSCGSVMLLLSDQPQVTPLLMRMLIEQYALHRASITAPIIAGQRGNPVLFDRSVFPALQAIEGDRGGRSLFSQFDVNWLPWIDDRQLLDVDTPADFENLKQAFFVKF